MHAQHAPATLGTSGDTAQLHAATLLHLVRAILVAAEDNISADRHAAPMPRRASCKSEYQSAAQGHLVLILGQVEVAAEDHRN